jgi:hypothetical protein
MENLWRKRTNIILLGEFNVNLSSTSTGSSDLPLKRKFLHLLNKFNLKNVINVPTRITADSSSLIDLIITSVSSKISHHGACNPGISDHHLIYAVVNLRKIPQKPTFKTINDFKRVDVNALKQEFSSAPWNICEIFDDVDDAAGAWESLYKYIINHHIPLRKVKVRSNSLP